MHVGGSKNYLRILTTKFLLSCFKFNEFSDWQCSNHLQFHYDKMVNSKHDSAVNYRENSTCEAVSRSYTKTKSM